MPYCAVLECKNKSWGNKSTNEAVSFHRFPKEPDTKLKWMEATGRQNWFPLKTSTICSKHFQEHFIFTSKGGRRYLCDAAIPEKNVLQFQSALLDNLGTSSETKSLKHKIDDGATMEACSKRRRVSNDKAIIQNKENKIKKQNLKIRKLRARNLRLKRKIKKIGDVLKTLEDKCSIDPENLTVLKNTNVKVNDLVARQMQNLNSGTVTSQTYSAELRSFALTLHYYSPKAYIYVRSTFNSCLPHPQTLKKWYAKMNGDPGFTEEAFKALKLKADSSNGSIIATLAIDEMAIRRRVEWDGHKFHGYVDMGTGLEGDHLPEAKEALVFLVTAINRNFKIPVAFFLVDGVTGVQRASLVCQCFERVHETGVRIVALTFDGCAANISMATNLGCSFQTGNIKFTNPVTKQPIVVILDPCHMVKLIRNAFQNLKTFVADDGTVIDWQYVVELSNLQDSEKFHLANKLKHGHINFQNQRMKVKLAAQLFSRSVAEAMTFCRTELNIETFKESAATEKFLLIINNLFDIFNSRNPHQYGFKKALSEKNATQIFSFLNSACSYISSLRTKNGQLLKDSPRKTGFLGFLACAEALKELYVSLIQEKIIVYLPFYKLSQDHLELLFGNIRAHGGSNNNPTARQFVAAYKKLLVHVDLKDYGTGNCSALEQLGILNCSSAVERINKTAGPILTEDEQSKDLTEEYEIGELLNNLSEFGSQVIAYIAGYIARMLIKKVTCNICVKALITEEKNGMHRFIVAKDKGGLVYPSKDVINICKVAESVLRIYEGRIFKQELIMCKILQKFVGERIFDGISFHQIGQFPDSNHVADLIKAIAERYINVRIHHLLKINMKLTKRQLLNKYVLFQGQ